MQAFWKYINVYIYSSYVFVTQEQSYDENEQACSF